VKSGLVQGAWATDYGFPTKPIARGLLQMVAPAASPAKPK
jgi:hypothetical protein